MYIKHSMDGTPVYRAWISLKARCFNANDKDYKNYGGRGITVCKRWKNNFKNFYADMGDKPTLKHSIDRINVDGNYNKKNCRWATINEQNNNKKNHHFLLYNGEKLNITQWSKIFKIPVSTLINRLNRGWTVKKTLEFPIEKHNKRKI